MSHSPAIIFDLGKVLLDFDYHKAVVNLGKHSPLSETELHTLINQSPLLFQYETGLLTTAQFFEEIRKVSKFGPGLENFLPIFGDIFEEIPEMIELHRTLRNRGFPTYIFSNTNELAINHIKARYPFFSEFDGYVLSYEQRSMKPDARIYQAVETLTGLRGSDLLYLDDRAENIEAGAGRGWQVIHHTDPATTKSALKKLNLI